MIPFLHKTTRVITIPRTTETASTLPTMAAIDGPSLTISTSEHFNQYMIISMKMV